jgi:predicted secreted hydrolase
MITIPEFDLEINVSALFPEQEMPIIGPLKAIWEGACSVRGINLQKGHKSRPIEGKGFMELVGYANFKC